MSENDTWFTITLQTGEIITSSGMCCKVYPCHHTIEIRSKKPFEESTIPFIMKIISSEKLTIVKDGEFFVLSFEIGAGDFCKLCFEYDIVGEARAGRVRNANDYIKIPKHFSYLKKDQKYKKYFVNTPWWYYLPCLNN